MPAQPTSQNPCEAGSTQQVAVNGPLEFIQDSNRFLIDKWEELHQDHRAQPALGVDPIKGVVESCPGKASCRSPAGIRGSVDQETQPPFFGLAWLNIDVA